MKIVYIFKIFILLKSIIFNSNLNDIFRIIYNLIILYSCKINKFDESIIYRY